MFFRLGAKKKTNRNHASRWRHGPDKEELANHEVSCDSKFQPAQHLAKAQKKPKKTLQLLEASCRDNGSTRKSNLCLEAIPG